MDNSYTRMHKFWKILAFIILVLVCIFFSFPSLAKTNFGKKIIVKIIEKRLKADVHVTSLHLRWLGPQTVIGGQIKNKNWEASFKTLQINKPLWFFLFSKDSRLISEGNLELEQGKALIYTQENSAIYIEDISISRKIRGKKLVEISADGKTMKENTKGNFSVYISPSSKKIKLENFPSILLENFFSLKFFHKKNILVNTLRKNSQALSTTLDETLNLTYEEKEDKGEKSLSLHLISGKNILELLGKIQNNTFYLSKDLQATLDIKPTFFDSFFKNIHPLFVTAIKAIHPISIAIEAKGFALPLDFSIEKISIKKGAIDVGKLTCKNSKLLSLILSMLQQKNMKKTSTMIVWCTPLYFQLEQGIFQTDRMDALLDDALHICIWGNIFLTNYKLNMILGIPADTLTQTFKIKNLPKNFVLQIPIKGTVQSPEIRGKKLGKKIAQLILLMQSSNEEEKNSKILQKIGLIDKDPPAPNKPFPWDKALSN